MLRHYDRIGLLAPSRRTESDHRLYDEQAVVRLHWIQVLRQIESLDRQAQRLNELCSRLRLAQSLSIGRQSGMETWLSLLASLEMFSTHFSASELQTIFSSATKIDARWKPLVADIADAMNRGLSPRSPEVQSLAQRWMDLSVQMTNGDLQLMKRWEQMYLQEPAARGRHGDSIELVRFINQAIELRPPPTGDAPCNNQKTRARRRDSSNS